MSNEIIQPMSPGDVQKWLERHPKPWKANHELFGNSCITDQANNEIDGDDLAAYVLFLEHCRCQQQGEIEAFKEMHDALVESYNKLKREHEPDYHCEYCGDGMLESDRNYSGSSDMMHCSQECADKAEANR